MNDSMVGKRIAEQVGFRNRTEWSGLGAPDERGIIEGRSPDAEMQYSASVEPGSDMQAISISGRLWTMDQVAPALKALKAVVDATPVTGYTSVALIRLEEASEPALRGIASILRRRCLRDGGRIELAVELSGVTRRLLSYLDLPPNKGIIHWDHKDERLILNLRKAES